MPKVTITSLNAAGPLTGAELIPVKQNGQTVRTTTQAIAALGGGSGSGGGGAASIDVVANGKIGGPIKLTVNQALFVPEILQNGTTSLSILSLPRIVLTGGGGYGGGNFEATSVAFPTLTSTDDFNVYSTNTLQTLSAPVLESVFGNLDFTSNSALTSVNFSSLKTVTSSFNLGNTPNLTSATYPALESVGYLYMGQNNPGFSSVNGTMFPALRTTAITIYTSSVTSVNLPALTKLTGFSYGASGLTSINLPGLVKADVSYMEINFKSTFTSLTLGTVGTLKKFGNTSSNYFNFTNCSLNEASVDNLLILMASLDGTNGTEPSSYGSLYMHGGNNATPSEAGLAAKAVLLARGWNITHN